MHTGAIYYIEEMEMSYDVITSQHMVRDNRSYRY